MKGASLFTQFALSTPSHFCPERIQAAPTMVVGAIPASISSEISNENEP
jgi:hypothetical protein